MLLSVELTEHLPYDALETLVQRFRGYLQQEFQLMIHKWGTSHDETRTGRTPSGQSDSAVSIAKQVQGVTTDLNLCM
jgi:hypothetical protein